MKSQRPNALIALAISVVSSLFATGCTAGRKAAYLPRAQGTPAAASAMVETSDVEVLLDRAPARPFAIVGDLHARTISNPNSILAMQERAGREGLDGIYWIECTSTCSGVCSAKGFVYLDGDATPGEPSLKPSEIGSVASR